MENIAALRLCEASQAHLSMSKLIGAATGNNNYLVIQNSTNLGKSANWATHHLYAVQRKDSEPQSAYPYNNKNPNDPVVDFAKFFDGDSLDQEDIVM